MKNQRLIVLAAAAFVVIAFAGFTCCDDWMPECYDACQVLKDCENEWLVADGAEEMDEAVGDEFYDACMDECEAGKGGQADIDCVYYASCDELEEGRCI